MFLKHRMSAISELYKLNTLFRFVRKAAGMVEQRSVLCGNCWVVTPK